MRARYSSKIRRGVPEYRQVSPSYYTREWVVFGSAESRRIPVHLRRREWIVGPAGVGRAGRDGSGEIRIDLVESIARPPLAEGAVPMDYDRSKTRGFGPPIPGPPRSSQLRAKGRPPREPTDPIRPSTLEYFLRLRPSEKRIKSGRRFLWFDAEFTIRTSRPNGQSDPGPPKKGSSGAIDRVRDHRAVATAGDPG